MFVRDFFLIFLRPSNTKKVPTLIKLEIRARPSRTIGWHVYLERVAENRRIEKWNPPTLHQNYWWIEWEDFPVYDGVLNVYVTCTGYGASVRCNVLINGARPSDANLIEALSEDDEPREGNFEV